MPFVPPWEDVTPNQFVQAAAEGERIGEASRAARASEALEAARMQQAASEAAANRGMQFQEMALRAKLAGEQLSYDRGEQARQDALRQAQINRPDILSTGRGGVGSYDPATGQFTQLSPSEPFPVKQPVETYLDKLNLERYRALASARNEALKSSPPNPELAQKYSDEMMSIVNAAQQPTGAGNPLKAGPRTTPRQVPQFGDVWKHNSSFIPFSGGTVTRTDMGQPSAQAALPDFGTPAPIPLNAPAVPTGRTPRTVTTQSAYDALPSGPQYIGDDGQTYQKP